MGIFLAFYIQRLWQFNIFWCLSEICVVLCILWKGTGVCCNVWLFQRSGIPSPDFWFLHSARDDLSYYLANWIHETAFSFVFFYKVAVMFFPVSVFHNSFARVYMKTNIQSFYTIIDLCLYILCFLIISKQLLLTSYSRVCALFWLSLGSCLTLRKAFVLLLLLLGHLHLIFFPMNYFWNWYVNVC